MTASVILVQQEAAHRAARIKLLSGNIFKAPDTEDLKAQLRNMIRTRAFETRQYLFRHGADKFRTTANHIHRYQTWRHIARHRFI